MADRGLRARRWAADRICYNTAPVGAPRPCWPLPTLRESVSTQNPTPADELPSGGLKRLLGVLLFGGARLLSWRARRGLANLTGGYVMRRNRRRRRASRANLDLAFGDALTPERKEAIAAASFRNFARCLLDAVALIPRLTRDNWHRLVHVPDEDLIRTRKYLAEGKGLLVMFAHQGNWELMGAAMAFMDLAPINVVAKRQADWANAYIEGLRSRTGNRVIYKEGAVRRTLKALKQGEIVGLAIDQNFSQGIFVPFFGVPAATVDSLGALARASGAPIVPLLCYPNEDGSYTGRLLPALRPHQTEDKARDVFDTTRDCLAALEDLIRERPELWLWSHKRWKSRPPDEDPPLALYETAATGGRD